MFEYEASAQWIPPVNGYYPYFKKTVDYDFGMNTYDQYTDFPCCDGGKRFGTFLNYEGEYQLVLNYGSNPLNISNTTIIEDGYFIKIEVVSFPFIPNADYSDCNTRVLTLIDTSKYNFQVNISNPGTKEDYVAYDPKIPSSGNVLDMKLYLLSIEDMTNSDGDGFNGRSTLASKYFVHREFYAGGIVAISTRILYPHSVLKHTIYSTEANSLGCNNCLSELSWTTDFTRGHLRDYPYVNCNDAINCSYCHSSEGTHDLTVFIDVNNTYPTLKYLQSKYGPIVPAPSTLTDWGFHTFSNTFTKSLFYPPLHQWNGQKYIFTHSVRGYRGRVYAGYKDEGNSVVTKMQGIQHIYRIYQNFDLTIINPFEQIIYNPSEVEIYADDLHFPECYTFKTLRSQYPKIIPSDPNNPLDLAYLNSVYYKYNNRENGGPYSDLRQVPIPTDMSSAYDPYDAAVYILKAGSQLTLDPGVTVYDATFKIDGGNLVFDPETVNGRFKVVDSSGNELYLHKTSYYNKITETIDPNQYPNVVLPDNSSNSQTLTTETYYANLIELAGNSTEVLVGDNAHVKLVGGQKIHFKAGFKTKRNKYLHAYFGKKTGCTSTSYSNTKIASFGNNNMDNQVEKFDELLIYPNPAQELLNVKLTVAEAQDLRLNVLDLSGKMIESKNQDYYLNEGNNEVSLSLEGLAKGMYLLKLKSEKFNKTLKFTKL